MEVRMSQNHTIVQFTCDYYQQPATGFLYVHTQGDK